MAINYDINIVEVLALLGGAGTFILATRTILSKLEVRMGSVERFSAANGLKIDELGKLLVTQARTEERINNMRRELDELKRGRGWIIEEFPNALREAARANK